MKVFDNIKVLFLAHYAPKNVFDPIPDNIEDVVYAIYHHKVLEELTKVFSNIFSSNDVSVLFDPNKHFDYIFSLYNRMPFRNSEIFVSSIAEYFKVPYLGSTPNIRALAEDKHLAKMMAKHVGVPTPDWIIYNVGDILFEPSFSPPYFIKPRFGAASKYISEDSICNSWSDAIKQINKLFDMGIDVIVEKQIKGIYHTSPVLNNFGKTLCLPCIEQRSNLSGGVVTYKQKRKLEPGLTRSVVEDDCLTETIHNYSKKMFSVIQPLDYTRFDYIIDENETPYFLEFNVCCNLGEHSTISQAAMSLGISYEQLIQNILYSSLHRNKLINETFGKDF